MHTVIKHEIGFIHAIQGHNLRSPVLIFLIFASLIHVNRVMASGTFQCQSFNPSKVVS